MLGVCLPIAALRRLANKVLSGQVVADDYDLHCAAIADCKFRSPIAEAVQRDLDRRYTQALRQAAKAKSTEALAAWWEDPCTCGVAAVSLACVAWRTSGSSRLD